jgi:pimeloyl-ACP methyl ester carboxylesterase
VELITSDGVHLEARRWSAAGAAHGTVVLVHGFGACTSDEKVLAVADRLAGAGYDVVSYDSRGHGRSGGEATLGDLEHLDVAAAVDAADGDGGPVLLVGASMGAIAVLRYAAGSPGAVAGLVTVSCPARWELPRNARGVLSALLTQTGVGRAFARRRLGVRIARRGARAAPPVDLIGVVGAPVSVVHGDADPFIPVEAARALEPRRLDVVAGLGHAYEPPAIAPILRALDWCAAPSTPAHPAS